MRCSKLRAARSFEQCGNCCNRTEIQAAEHAVEEIFDDLLVASRAKDSISESDPYFLGSIVLVKAEKQPLSEVVDGQQRLTTLTILLGILREYVSPGFAASGPRVLREVHPGAIGE
ncbi:DUF262 domain-containing protein [Amycolatopsis sp. H6(2020)]|nr:DUF262 domain-containing protein [Amycolatopsis sp. H6(2020)]